MEHKSDKKNKKKQKKSKSKSINMGSTNSADAAPITDRVIPTRKTKIVKEKIVPLSEAALAVFNQFPTDVLEEIFVRLLDLPQGRNSASTWKLVSQTCKTWHTINTSNTFWYKATSHYFPEFVASAKHDPHISFMQEFKKLACRLYDMKTMGITWLNEQYWVTVNKSEGDEEICADKKDMKSDWPNNLYLCKDTLPNSYAKLDSVCWLDVRTYATVNCRSMAKLLVCLKLTGGHIGDLNIDIHAGIKNIADDEPKWEKLNSYVWQENEQERVDNGKWIYLDLGTVDLANVKGHGLETIELQGQIWTYSGDWKGGLCISHLKCIQLPRH